LEDELKTRTSNPPEGYLEARVAAESCSGNLAGMQKANFLICTTTGEVLLKYLRDDQRQLSDFFFEEKKLKAPLLKSCTRPRILQLFPGPGAAGWRKSSSSKASPWGC